MNRDEIQNLQKKSYESVKAAYENEAHLFIHVHLRGYDDKGQGNNRNAKFFDRYGAPIDFVNTWKEGYRSIEEALLIHNEMCSNNYTYFPRVGAYCGGAHLYKKYNNTDPWNWTGWIPQQRQLPYNSVDGSLLYANRFFACLRGNEIQNDMWDYDPDVLTTDKDVKGPYLGGYWYKNNVSARYLHIVSLKSHEDGDCRRYNYVVHPLAYRGLLNNLPDCGVDGIQWSVNNIQREDNIKKDKWKGKVNGVELFNDFTYYYSWVCHYGYKFYNGSVRKCGMDGQEKRIVWYDTYPLEFCEFVLDKALSSGTYLQTLSANDAFYNRQTSHVDIQGGEKRDPSADGEDDMEPAEIILRNQALLADPKGKYVTETLMTRAEERSSVFSPDGMIESEYERFEKRFMLTKDDTLTKSNSFLESRPYGFDTVFGYIVMLDPSGLLKKTLYPSDETDKMDLNSGESIILNYLLNGQFYCHTGIYNVFDYKKSKIQIPFIVKGQPKTEELWFNDKMKKFTMKFEFPPEKKITEFPPPWDGKLIWRYTIEYVENNERVLSTGYFKLNQDKPTQLDLQSYYGKFKVKWIRFTTFYIENPQQRAWFSPIRGKNFNLNSEDLPLRNRLGKTKQDSSSEDVVIFTDTGEQFLPTSAERNDKLDYIFEKGEEQHLHSYFMQVKPLQQTATFSEEEPVPTENKKTPRYLQNVHGYFALSKNYPTEIVLSHSWDSLTVKDNKMFFYRVNGQTCELLPLKPRQQ